MPEDKLADTDVVNELVSLISEAFTPKVYQCLAIDEKCTISFDVPKYMSELGKPAICAFISQLQKRKYLLDCTVFWFSGDNKSYKMNIDLVLTVCYQPGKPHGRPYPPYGLFDKRIDAIKSKQSCQKYE